MTCRLRTRARRGPQSNRRWLSSEGVVELRSVKQEAAASIIDAAMKDKKCASSLSSIASQQPTDSGFQSSRRLKLSPSQSASLISFGSFFLSSRLPGVADWFSLACGYSTRRFAARGPGSGDQAPWSCGERAPPGLTRMMRQWVLAICARRQVRTAICRSPVETADRM